MFILPNIYFTNLYSIHPALPIFLAHPCQRHASPTLFRHHYLDHNDNHHHHHHHGHRRHQHLYKNNFQAKWDCARILIEKGADLDVLNEGGFVTISPHHIDHQPHHNRPHNN